MRGAGSPHGGAQRWWAQGESSQWSAEVAGTRGALMVQPSFPDLLWRFAVSWVKSDTFPAHLRRRE